MPGQGEEGKCDCVCLRVSERLVQRGDIGRVASAHRHQKEGVERTGAAFVWCGQRNRDRESVNNETETSPTVFFVVSVVVQ